MIQDLESKVTEILDRLTQEIKIEDAAVMVGGFYAGMNGYTPLSALMKMNIIKGETDTELIQKLLRYYFIANGVFIPLLLESTPAMKEEAESFKGIPIDDMDPRKISADYLYERRLYLKSLLSFDLARIELLKAEIIGKQRIILDDQAMISTKQTEIANLKSQLSGLESQIASKVAEIAALDKDYSDKYFAIDAKIREYQEAIRKLQAAPPSPERDKMIMQITIAIEQLGKDQAKLTSLYAVASNQLQQDLQTLRSQQSTIPSLISKLEVEIESIQAAINQIQGDINELQNTLDNLLGSRAAWEKEIRKIDLELLKIKTALGMVGMIEAYAITRPGTISGIGDIIKGLTSIIPG